MTYKGYDITVMVDVTETWDFESDNTGNISLTCFIEGGDAYFDHGSEFVVRHDNCDTEYFEMLDDAKSYIDGLPVLEVA